MRKRKAERYPVGVFERTDPSEKLGEMTRENLEPGNYPIIRYWSIYSDPSFDDHLGRVARRKAQKSEALRRIRNIVAPNVKVWKIYGEWCVVTRAGEIAITSSDWLTAWKWAQRMYGRPF